MELKSFKLFISEAITQGWIKTTFDSFKNEFETKVKEFTGKPFKVGIPVHYFEQLEMRTGIDPKAKDNIFITEPEIINIYDKIQNKFFNHSSGNGGVIKVKSPNNFKINPETLRVNRDGTQTADWEFQHKISFEDHFRCALYAVSIVVAKELGKDVVIAKPELRFITIFPSNRDGKDNPKYKFTNELTESVNLDTLNYNED